ncbi:MAG: zf-HC2 domain-containing protein [Deltaproteobacteria bacterium]|nr:zf-HC2 domain-containing protein [Deltaproteobacteria bacterium]
MAIAARAGMTCREVEKLLDLFLDGELEARTMRTVALHVTRCEPCEALLQGLERLQDVVGDTIGDAVAEVDFARFWPSIAAEVDGVQRSWRGLGGRVRALARTPLVIAAAMAAALVVSAIALWREMPAIPPPPTVVNNQVRIDTLTSDAPAVALLSESATNTTVIWISEEGRGR